MSKAKELKLKIFKIFSQNLEWVKEHESIEFRPDFQNGYICPLCFDVFFEKDLDSSLQNYLTLEDIPPKSLGGKPKALTCKTCNSKSGHELDIYLLNTLLEMDSHEFLANSKTKAVFELNGNVVNGVIEIDQQGTFILDLQTNRSNPVKAKQFLKDLIPPRTFYGPSYFFENVYNRQFQTPAFKVEYHKKTNESRAQIALLRIAYLIAFSTLGNGFYFNSGLYKIREQILNPEKNIIPKAFWIKYDFPKEMEGINIITLPKELRCFLIVFTLSTKSKARQFSIVLPGPSDPGIKVYDFIEQHLNVGDGSIIYNGIIEHIADGEYLKNKESAFLGNWYWQEYTKDDYTPRLMPYK